MEPWIERFTGIAWESYATGDASASIIRMISLGVGGCLLLGCVSICRPRFGASGTKTAETLESSAHSALSRWALERLRNTVLYGASVLLLAFALLQWSDGFYRAGELMGQATQVLTPALLAYALWHRHRAQSSQGELLASERWSAWKGIQGMKGWSLMARWAVAATFFGHGLFASGWHPVPGHYVDMTMGLLGIEETAARELLRLFGAWDFAVALALVWPGRIGRKIRIPALAFAALWGFLTAMARVVWGFEASAPWHSLDQWLHETLIRMPHFAIPLALLLHTTGQSPPRSPT